MVRKIKAMNSYPEMDEYYNDLPPIPDIKCADDIAAHQEAVLIHVLGPGRYLRICKMEKEKNIDGESST